MVYLSPYSEDVWCYWIISVGALFSFVGLIVACICSCRQSDNKSEFSGLEGMVKLKHLEHESFNRISTSTEGLQVIQTQDVTDAAGKRSNTANRSLPDIPKDKCSGIQTDPELRDVIYEAGTDVSELYATVQDKGKNKKEKKDKQTLSQQSSQDETASLYARLQTPQTSTEEHPYALVQNDGTLQTRSSSNNNLAKPSTSGVIFVNKNPVAPPRSRRSSSHNSLLEQTVQNIPAASAITGGIQANQDLPYMTPPLNLLMPLPQPPESLHNNQQHFSGDSQDSKGYTSISVREPLANILAQTKTVQKQHQRVITDPHYATVSDDSDEMYAAIDEPDKVYTSGSETYAQIQPLNTVNVEISRPTSNEAQSLRSDDAFVPVPQPPSVDSLRHVAHGVHAHSRQASSSSANSSVANPGSPKPEKRQANSPLPPPPEEIAVDMYAVVEKRNKSEVLPSTSRNPGLISGKSVEDMYAKVIKKKREIIDESFHQSDIIEQQTQLLKLMEPTRALWSSHESVEIQKQEIFERVNGEFDMDFEILSDRRASAPLDVDYETLRPQSNKKKLRSSQGNLPIYSHPFKQRQVSDASSEDPGYEKVRLRRRFDIIDVDTDSEPNYESMPHENIEPNYASVCRGGDSDADPNYESVLNGDPNYESVKYMSLERKEISEPPYEQLSNLKGGKYGSNTIDPDYEKIQALNFLEQDTINGDTDDEQYIQV